MNLDEKTYIEQQVSMKAKSTPIAYLLWFFLGSFGAHRFYLGRIGSAVVLLLLTIFIGWCTFFIPTFIWLIIDAFLIPGIVRESEEKIRQQAYNEVKLMRKN